MQLTFITSAALAVGLATAASVAMPSGCPLDNCLFAKQIPTALRAPASTLCELYLHSTPGTKTSTAYSTIHATTVVTAAPASTTVVTTTTTTTTAGSVCSLSSTGSTTLSTSVTYPSLAPNSGSSTSKKRSNVLANLPAFITNGCKIQPSNVQAKLSSACACFLTSATATVTLPTTVYSTSTVYPPTVTVVSTVTSTATTTSCTSTYTPPPTLGAFSCGVTYTAAPTASTSGTKTCASSVPTPSNIGLFRIEGNDSEGTIFEDCILAGPRVVTTPSGGSHECDGTNNGANPDPGTTPTDQIDAAANQNGFGYDGTYDSQFQDFFITSISTTTQTSNDFWGILVNGQFTPTGGCQFEVSEGDRSLWSYNAFNFNAFLRVTPDYASAQAGQGTISVTVTNEQAGSPFAGATMAGATSNSAGVLTFAVPSTPGCYQYKATASGSGRSNAFYLTVVQSFS